MTIVRVDWSVVGKPVLRYRYSGSNTHTWHIIGELSTKDIHSTSFPDTPEGKQEADAVLNLYREHWQEYTRKKSGLFTTPQTI